MPASTAVLREAKEADSQANREWDYGGKRKAGAAITIRGGSAKLWRAARVILTGVHGQDAGAGGRGASERARQGEGLEHKGP